MFFFSFFKWAERSVTLREGHLVSGLAKGRVPVHLISSAEARAALLADPGESLKRAFSKVDDELNETSGIDIEYSGSTAVACVLRGKTLTTAGPHNLAYSTHTTPHHTTPHYITSHSRRTVRT